MVPFCTPYKKVSQRILHSISYLRGKKGGLVVAQHEIKFKSIADEKRVVDLAQGFFSFDMKQSESSCAIAVLLRIIPSAKTNYQQPIQKEDCERIDRKSSSSKVRDRQNGKSRILIEKVHRKQIEIRVYVLLYEIYFKKEGSFGMKDAK